MVNSQGMPKEIFISHKTRPRYKYASKSEDKPEPHIESMATLTAVMKAKQYLEKLRTLKKFE